MRRWLKRSVSLFFIVFFGILSANAAWADCATTEIDVLGDGTQCETAKFTVTTTSDTTQFNFEINAAGTFYIDWGDGSAVETISNATVDDAWLLHDYDDEGEYTIRLGGVATAYESSIITTTIAFSTNESIASVSGSLATLFPQFGSNLGEYPIFDSTFYYATNLTSVPSGLFSGGNLVGGANMFSATFYHSGLTSIPSGLFNGINTGAEYMFDQTFAGCTNLTSIPVGLFSSITSGAEEMFYSTFYGCTTLTAIPPRLFAGITTAASGMFDRTFYNCSSLSGYIPPSAFAGLIANGHPTASGMWGGTFYGTNLATSCTSPLTQYTSGYEGTGNNTWEGRVSCSRTCAAGEIDVYGDGSQCETSKFEITTTSDTTRFYFTMRAAGTFYIDWGDGSPVQILTYASAGNSTGVSHTFPSSGSYTIRFGGLGTSYPGCGGDQSTLDFTNNGWYQAKVASVSGSLGALLPQYGTAYGQYPCFLQQFNGCTNLTSIPSTLFSGITGGVGYMFYTTFSGCTNLTSIPAGLFDDVTTGATSQFALTFKGCTKLTNIPDGLFSNITTVTGSNLFNETFRNCTALTSLPENLFSGITTAHERLFSYAFDGCTNLSGAIPLSTFSGLLNNNTPVNSNMFSNTFTNTALNTSCGANEVTYAVYKPYWSGKVVCRAACPSGQIATGTTGCEAEKFSLTTTSDTTSFSFNMTARGTFYVDWGDGSVQTIARSNNNQATYSHTYSTAGAYTIRFGGTATLYSTTSNMDYRTAAIGFYYPSTGTQAKIASVSGSLGAMFPILGSAANQKPKFTQTFMGATNLAEIPSTLFSGLVGGPYMFDSTFKGCTGLTTIAPTLFQGATTGAERMFRYTFQNCTGLTTIPDGLFSYTTTSDDRLFHGTFAGCAGLTALPENLFAGLTNTAGYMFMGTFNGCSNLTGFIPPSFVSGLIARGSPKPQGMWESAFANTALLTACPAGYAQYITGYEGTSGANVWNGKVSCTPCPTGTYKDVVGNQACSACPVGTYMANTGATSCTACTNTKPANSTYSTSGGATNTCAWECDSGYINTGTSCEQEKFSVTTTDDTSNFVFSLSAKGTFYVDWGDGNVQTIERNDTTNTEYSHTYTTADSYIIRFGSENITAYSTTPVIGAISFYKASGGTQTKIASLSGSLGALLPVVANNVYPRFRETFRGATTLTSIPAGLFNGINADISNNVSGMFVSTFSGCTGLTSVTPELFNPVDISNATNVSSMFYSTFSGCTGLSSIPAGVFSAINPSNATNTSSMFRDTFYQCTGLSSIPVGLFNAIDTSNATNTESMFERTFADCTGLTGSIPSDLFSMIDTSSATNTSSMFSATFQSCRKLTGSIPAGLFGAIDTSNATKTNNMFYSTFMGSGVSGNIPSGLFSEIDVSGVANTSHMFERTFNGSSVSGSIPAGLFSAINTSNATNTESMFAQTFYNCANLTGISAGAFGAIDTSNVTNAKNMFSGTFAGCTHLSSIPTGLFSAIDTSNVVNASNMFSETFNNCPSLTSIPDDLFSEIDTGSATNTSNMFYRTFYQCGGLTEIPGTLFSAIDTSRVTNASNMFRNTFAACANLSSIPAGLFSTINTSNVASTDNMFAETFVNSSRLGSYIPPTTFPNTIHPGTSSSSGMWSNTFKGTQLLTQCPLGTTQYITGFESDWNGKVSCEPCPGTLPEHASYTTAGTCDWACDSGYMNTGTSCEQEKFSVTTTSDATTLSWIITSTGEFYVDCGDGGSLSQRSYITGSTTSGKKITRTTAGIKTIYSCKWNSAGVHTVRFGGVATGYSTSTTDAAITFYHSGGTPASIASIDGSLGAMFPTINGAIPRFYQTFQDCKNLTGIPTGLFSAIDTSSATDTSSMFDHTFYGCTGLTGIPAELFSTIDTSSAADTNHMFAQTFYGCTGLTSISAGLFGAIDTSSATNTSYMFADTFWNCNNLTSIPAGLFGAIDTSSATNTAGMFYDTFRDCNKITNIPTGLFSAIDTSSATNTAGMFYGTFGDVSGLTSIPTGLFSGIDTSSATDTHEMFYYTFHGCNKITSIPSGLFSGVDTSSSTNTQRMFSSTFGGCTRLTEIPTGLFSAVNTSSAIYAQSMFSSTFSGCKGVTEIPTGLFSGIDTSSVVYASDMFNGTFYGCTGLTSIPAGLFSAIDTSSATDTSRMFQVTFNGCGNITGYIPPTTFPSTIQPGSSDDADMWSGAFENTQLLTQCPLGTTQYITGFESDWNGKVSCEPCAGTLPEHASYATAGTCDWECDSEYINTGTSCEETKFSVNTTGGTFVFGLTAKGTFYVDWGDGSAVQKITRNNTTRTEYSHGFTSGTYTIRFGGAATGYSMATTSNYGTTTVTGAIDFFGKNSNGVVTTISPIASVSGSLGALMPQLGNNDGQFPRFVSTFLRSPLTTVPDTLFSGLTGGTYMFKSTFDSSGVTTLPAGLFSGITTPANWMFNYTFKDCSHLTTLPDRLFGHFTSAGEHMFESTFYEAGLTSLPANLFAGITTGSSNLFNMTFYKCRGLSTVPAALFNRITTGAEWLFISTFRECSGLTSVPEGLFSGLTSGAPGMFAGTFEDCINLPTVPAGLFSGITTGAQGLFNGTFNGCTRFTTIPSGLFNGITAGAQGMFRDTFRGCSRLANVPSDLFSRITTGAQSMFYQTFSNCTSLTAIPSNLFSGITTPATDMFERTFYGSSNLAGYIPKTTFAGLITNDGAKNTDMWDTAFYLTAVDTSCPAGTAQYVTGYESQWGYSKTNVSEDDGTYRVSCEPCPTGTYKDVVGNQACSACPNGTYMADTGATSCTACPALDTGYAYADGTGWAGWNQCSEQMRPTNCAGGYLTKPASSASAWGTAVSTLTAAGGYKVTGSGNNTVCSACGAGYYSPSGVNTCTACASGLTTIGYGPGADEATDCGHMLHAGDGILYLRSVKKTTPSLNVRIGNAVFYGNMSTLEKVMSAGSTRKLKINNGGTIYHVHDDSVDLPSGYTQVAYVQSSGNQAIDTGIIMTNAHEVRAKFNPSALSKYLYGSVSSGNSTSYTAYLSSAGNWRFGNRTIAIPTSANTLYESVQNSSGVTINGVSKGTYASTTFTSPNSLVLFGSHSTANAVSPNFSGKVYYIKIYNNGDAVFDGIPAKRNSDNVCGLYDMANNVFYASHTATAFICP